MLAWDIVPGIRISAVNEALKARFNPPGLFSIPNIALVEITQPFYDGTADDPERPRRNRS